jgi:ferredoxin
MPNSFTQLAALIVGLIIMVAMFWMAIISVREEEPKAARRAALLAVLLPVPFIGAALIPTQFGMIAAAVLTLSVVAAGSVLFLPVGKRTEIKAERPQSRFDERDIIFSRRELAPGTDRYREYYRRRPEKEPLDEKWRNRPGLMQEGALYYDPIMVSAAASSFKTVGAFHSILDDEQATEPNTGLDPAATSRFIKRWARKLGAVSVGITRLRPYHLYSHIGRGARYGEPVELSHPFAIALTVEMDKLLMDRAPGGPTVMESAQQYLNCGAIAVQLAEFARGLGHSARAHIDGSYHVICPLVARDAGLGEIGRMGLLMTPELGPRVRLAVVTTDLPLLPDQRDPDPTMLDFCNICLKCADLCPSKSIPFEGQTEVDGTMRWRIDSESCFTYWCTIGTDCGRCMGVCPYSHPDNLLHNLVRAGIRRSPLFRFAALKLDDFFYGREPETLDAPEWISGAIPS